MTGADRPARRAAMAAAVAATLLGRPSTARAEPTARRRRRRTFVLVHAMIDMPAALTTILRTAA